MRDVLDIFQQLSWQHRSSPIGKQGDDVKKNEEMLPFCYLSKGI